MGKRGPPMLPDEERSELILMQGTAGMRPPATPEFYPQHQSASGTTGMVTPRRPMSRKKFWQVAGDDGDEIETLVHRPDTPGHAPSEHGSEEVAMPACVSVA